MESRAVYLQHFYLNISCWCATGNSALQHCLHHAGQISTHMQKKIYWSLALGYHIGPLCMFTGQKMPLKLNETNILRHQNLVMKYVDNKPELELQCLFAIQSLINVLEHPQGKYYRTVHVYLKWLEPYCWLWSIAMYIWQYLTVNNGRIPTKVNWFFVFLHIFLW